MEKCLRVLPCGQRILFVQIAIAIPSLSVEEKDALRLEAERPPRFKEAGLKFLVNFLTQLANLSACVGICILMDTRRLFPSSITMNTLIHPN